MNKWLTVSWRKGSNKPRKEKDPLQSAFRQAIYTQIKNWKSENYKNKECALCKDTDHLHKKLQVDHSDPLFITLTKQFLSLPVNRDVPDTFGYHYRCGRKFAEKDYKFKRRWQLYHKKHANLQWICKSCNLKKKKSL